jgi:general secretion pathway protein D
LTNTDEFGVELGLQSSVLFDRSLLEGIQTLTETTTSGDPPTTVTNERIVAATSTPGYAFNNAPLGNSGDLSRSNVVGGQGLSNFAVGRINNELGFGGLVLSASSESVSFLLRALSESRRLDVLARPQITTLENQPAFVQVGQRVPYITQSNLIVGGGVQNTVAFQNVGLILLVQPRVSPDGLVVMDIHAERSEVGPEAEGIPISINVTGDVIRSPRINSTVAETTVSAANGQTIVLGGLLTKTKSETHRRVPLLADIPILGHLFRYDNVQNRRTELLIIMTPRVLRTREDAELFKQVESARMSWCLADVIKIHGESGLRGRHAEWTDAETTVIYPDMTPEQLQSLMSRSAEEIVTPQPTPAQPGTPQLAPPTSPPPSQPGGATPMRIPLDAPQGTDPPPMLPLPQPQSGTKSPGPKAPAGPVVSGPTVAPLQTSAAPSWPAKQPVAQPAQNATYYSAAPGPAPANGMQQPAQGATRQALYQLPVK